MTDKDKIRAEIERQIPLHICGYQNALKDVLKFIDSLPKQPISVSLDEELKRYLSEYYNYNYPMQYITCTGPSYMYHIVEVAKHFANWQKERVINKACEWLYQQQLVLPDVDKFIEDFRKTMED